MILIEGTPLYCFEPRMHFANTNCSFDDRYSYLDRALIRSKVHRDGHNYLVGEKLSLKNEYMEFANNLLIIHMNKDEIKFFIILKGHIFAVTEDYEDAEIKKFFGTYLFSVIDSFGKELEIDSYEKFSEFVCAAKEAETKFNYKLEQYHKHMESLFELRRTKSESFCCFISEYYDKLVYLSDDIAKEMCDALSAYHDCKEYNVVDKYIHRPNEEEKLCVIFGLYLACLRAYELNFDADPLSLDERIYLGFVKEFNYFLSQNEGIIEKYAQYFNLRKVEEELIRNLLKEEGLQDNSDWCEPAELNIM